MVLKKHACFGLLLSLLGTSVQAADEALYFSDFPVVASVSRLPQRQADAPTSVTVIDREMIRASGARDLNDIFRLVPGFQTFPNNTDAARVSYHGPTDEDYSPRVQVLIDGRSMYSPLFGNGVNWVALPVAIEDIERIEVVRGSNSASYGSNAFLGVINIITLDPALVRGLSVSTRYGNQGVRDQTLRTGGKLGTAGDFRFTYQQKDDRGLTDRYDWVDSLRSRLFDLRVDLLPGDRDVVQLSAGQVRAMMPVGRLHPGEIQDTNPIRDYTQSNTYLQAMWHRSLGNDADFRMRYAYVEDRADDHFEVALGPLLYRVDQLGGRSTRQEIEAQHSFSPVDRLRMVWGAGWRSDALSSDLMLHGQGTVRRDVGRTFANLEWKPLNWLTGNLGMSAEDDTLAGTNTSPRLSASFHLTPENTIRLAYAKAYRTGSIVDYRGYALVSPYAASGGLVLTPEIKAAYSVGPLLLGNPGLPAERLETRELAYLGDWRQWRMSLDVRLFQERIPNRQMLSSTETVYMAEIQDIRTEGVEYQLKWQACDATRLMLGQSFIHIRSEFLAGAFGGPLAEAGAVQLRNLDELAEHAAPRRSSSALLMQRLPLGAEFSLAAYWQDRMKWSTNSWSEKYRRVDARLAYPFRWHDLRGELAYTVQSLNGAHGEFKAYGQEADRIVDRRQWLSLRLDF